MRYMIIKVGLAIFNTKKEYVIHMNLSEGCTCE